MTLALAQTFVLMMCSFLGQLILQNISQTLTRTFLFRSEGVQCAKHESELMIINVSFSPFHFWKWELEKFDKRQMICVKTQAKISKTFQLQNMFWFHLKLSLKCLDRTLTFTVHVLYIYGLSLFDALTLRAAFVRGATSDIRLEIGIFLSTREKRMKGKGCDRITFEVKNLYENYDAWNRKLRFKQRTLPDKRIKQIILETKKRAICSICSSRKEIGIEWPDEQNWSHTKRTKFVVQCGRKCLCDINRGVLYSCFENVIGRTASFYVDALAHACAVIRAKVSLFACTAAAEAPANTNECYAFKMHANKYISFYLFHLSNEFVECICASWISPAHQIESHNYAGCLLCI